MKRNIKSTNLQGLPKRHATPYHWIAKIASRRSILKISRLIRFQPMGIWPDHGWGFVVTKAKANSNLWTTAKPLNIGWANNRSKGWSACFTEMFSCVLLSWLAVCGRHNVGPLTLHVLCFLHLFKSGLLFPNIVYGPFPQQTCKSNIYVTHVAWRVRMTPCANSNQLANSCIRFKTNVQKQCSRYVRYHHRLWEANWKNTVNGQESVLSAWNSAAFASFSVKNLWWNNVESKHADSSPTHLWPS